MSNRIIQFLAILAIVIVQVSFLSTWPEPINGLNLILSLSIFIAVIISYRLGLFWAFTAGLLLELYSGLPFGVTTVGLILTIAGVNFLFSNFFTNRSLYSLIILGIIGTLGYNIIILILNFIGLIFGFSTILNNFSPWFYFFWQPFLNLLVLIVIFFAFYFSTGRLHNIFLFAGQSYERKP